ncbi:MAG: hypothetical protein LBR69_00535 [Endomicrobium sp.]|nr:hypothetical protein [Endomicrobium sp.]
MRCIDFAAEFGSSAARQLGNGKRQNIAVIPDIRIVILRAAAGSMNITASRRSSEVQQLGSLATEKDKTLPPSRIFVLSSCAKPQDL